MSERLHKYPDNFANKKEIALNSTLAGIALLGLGISVWGLDKLDIIGDERARIRDVRINPREQWEELEERVNLPARNAQANMAIGAGYVLVMGSLATKISKEVSKDH